MQWIEHEQTNSFHFWTLEGPGQIAELKFSPDSKTFRLHHNDHRFFFLENTGVLQQKIALKSEYGISLGEVLLQRHGQSGTIIVNDSKYFFTEDHAHINLFDKNKQLVARIGVDHLTELSIFELSSLLFAQAWIFPAIGTENTYPLASGFTA